MSEHQKQTAFLRQCLLYDDTAECHELEESITQLQRNERCVRRAVRLMALLIAFSMAGLCCSAVIQENDPQSMSKLVTQLAGKVFCALGLGSLICLVAFSGLGVVHRNQLDQRREDCRRLAAKLLESRLGKPRANEETAPAVAAESKRGKHVPSNTRN